MGVTSIKRISRAREDIALIDVFNLVRRKKIVKGELDRGNFNLRSIVIFIINHPAAVVKAVVIAGWGDEDYSGRVFGVVFENI